MSTTRVAVSYAWSEEESGQNKQAVDRFCAELGKYTTVVRDNDPETGVGLGDSLREFMRDLGREDLLCVFLSDAYLKSPNTLYELLVAWQRSKDHPEEFKSRVKVWTFDCANEIYTDEGRLDYVEFWKDKKESSEARRERIGMDYLGKTGQESHARTLEIAQNVYDILNHIGDKLGPQSVDEFAGWVKKLKGLEKKTTEQVTVEKVFENVLAEVEKSLAADPGTAAFLASCLPDLLTKKGNHWILSGKAHGSTFDLADSLEAIWKSLDSFKGSVHGFRSLEKFIGGLTVLGIDPNWVMLHRTKLSRSSAQFPSREANVVFEQKHADLLPLVSAALADGCIRLHHMFGEELVGRQLPDLPAVPAGTVESDREAEVKKHLVKCTQSVQKAEKCDTDEALEEAFQDVRDLLRNACVRFHEPYYGSSESYGRFERLLKEDLKLSDLYLIFPEGSGRFEKIFENHLLVFQILYDIFTVIQKQTGGDTQPREVTT